MLCFADLAACGAPSSTENGTRRYTELARAAPTPRDGVVPFCLRPREDTVSDVFCQRSPPDIRGLADLQVTLALTVQDMDAGQGYVNPFGQETRLALLDHSTALSGHLVSPINPRIIVFNRSTFLAFNRGVQQVEIAARDRMRFPGFNFYLVTFEQACTSAPGGCTPGDLYTPRIESDWVNVRIDDEDDLKDTPSDCRRCHQRGQDRPVLLMRELDGPWTHFFGPDEQNPNPLPEPSGIELLQDYLRAKGEEPYGNVPASAIRGTSGFTLQTSIDSLQPLIFDGSAILNERWPWSPGYAATPAPSPTWYLAFDAFKRGEQLALPHYDPRPTDPAKQAALTSAYQRYLSGDSPAADLPDLGEIFPDDGQLRAEIGLQAEPDAVPAELLIEACGSCHNDVLDQSISRARFNIDIARMSPAEVNAAVLRITLDPSADGRMPPRGARQLDDPSRQRLVEYLQSNVRTAEDDTRLAHAAQAGMAAAQPKEQVPSGF